MRLRPRTRRWLVVTALAAVIAGSSPSVRAQLTTAGDDAACEHPHPCDYQWEGPAGPLAARPVERIQVPSFDGILLDGWIHRPDVPSETPVPVVLVSSPYFGQTGPPGYDLAGAAAGHGDVPWPRLVSEGYAVALFSVRGTGNSGGCFSFFGPDEQRDQAFLVEWLAAQPWSNGRVGMVGLSYHGTTPVEAAIQNPPALKTIVIAGTVLDAYGFYHSPQGAMLTAGPAFSNEVSTLVSLVPPLLGDPTRVDYWALDHLMPLTQRVCAEVVATNTVLWTSLLTDERSPSYWAARRLIDRVPGITAATFVVHGFQDRYLSGHAFQDDWAWNALQSAPKRMLVGQWGHEFPDQNSFRPEFAVPDWNVRLLAWLDYWLKGVGAPPGIGSVDYQDSTGAWRTTSSWPPAEQTEEALYLVDGRLDPQPGSTPSSFISLPSPLSGGLELPCPDPTRAVFVTEPALSPTVIAGNPLAFLQVQSNLPSGQIDVTLFDVGPAFSCADGALTDVRILSEGTADLRYHDDEEYHAAPFPVAVATPVRVDISNLAEVLAPGHRLAAAVSYGEILHRLSGLSLAQIVLHSGGQPAGSHLLVPVISGGFGGTRPDITYPPRPFEP